MQRERRPKNLRYAQFACAGSHFIFTSASTGAGLLSSIVELRHPLSDETKPNIMAFDPEVTAYEECIITSFQNAYYYSDSFEEAKDKMRCLSIDKFLKNVFLWELC